MRAYRPRLKTIGGLARAGKSGVAAAALGLAASVLLFAGAPVKSAQAKIGVEPPQCTAIVVPGLPHVLSDGRHEAWVYKARFGRLALDGVMRNGNPIDYHFTLNGHGLEPLLGAASKPVAACLKAKGVVRPSRYTPHICAGERFKVILARPANERFLLLYVTTGKNSWRFCRASSVPQAAEPEHPKPKP